MASMQGGSYASPGAFVAEVRATGAKRWVENWYWCQTTLTLGIGDKKPFMVEKVLFENIKLFQRWKYQEITCPGSYRPGFESWSPDNLPASAFPLAAHYQCPGAGVDEVCVKVSQGLTCLLVSCRLSVTQSTPYLVLLASLYEGD